MTRGALLLLPALMVLPWMPVRAQEPSRADTTSAPDVPFRRWEAERVDSALGGAPARKSPATAMILSAVLPGAGQFYNGSYWKVPVVLGFGVYFVSSWLDNNRRYVEYRDRYAASVAATPSGDPQLLRVREFYKEQRDSFTWYFLVLYLLNLADSYVDASLSDFNVGGDLSIRFLPQGPGERTPRANICIRVVL